MPAERDSHHNRSHVRRHAMAALLSRSYRATTVSWDFVEIVRRRPLPRRSVVSAALLLDPFSQ
jgi:hypothetical protein